MFKSFFRAVGGFFRNIFKDIGKLITVIIQAFMIALAIVAAAFTFGLTLTFVPVFCAVLVVGLVALGTENGFLLKLMAVLSLVASVYLTFFAPGGLMGALDQAGIGSGSWVYRTIAFFQGDKMFWWRVSAFGYTVMSTAAMFRAVDNGTTYLSAFGSITGEVIGDVIGSVGGIIGAVVGGLIGLSPNTNFGGILAVCLGGYVAYKYLTRPEGTKVTLAGATSPADY